MRRVFPLLVLFISACSQAPAPTSNISAGCQEANDPLYDERYQSASIFFSPFRAQETLNLRFDASNLPASTDSDAALPTLYLDIVDTANSVRIDQLSVQGDELSYVFSQDYAQVELYWVMTSGAVVDWQVGCRVQD